MPSVSVRDICNMEMKLLTLCLVSSLHNYMLRSVGGMPQNPQPAGSQPFRECLLLRKVPSCYLIQNLKFQKSAAAS